MAKIKFGATVADARNALDGVVYSKNQYGAYVRIKVSPVQPRTTEQLNQRARFAASARSYSGDTSAAERTLWTDFAAVHPVTDVFGNSQVLSAVAMYGRVNNTRQRLGLAIITAPPADMSVDALLTGVVTMGDALQTASVAFTATPLGAAHYLYLWATPALPAGRSFFRPYLRYIGASAAAQVSPFAAGALYVARFGMVPAVGSTVGWLVATANGANGAISTGISQVVTVGA